MEGKGAGAIIALTQVCTIYTLDDWYFRGASVESPANPAGRLRCGHILLAPEVENSFFEEDQRQFE